MAMPLLRAGVLGALRRLLQTTADERLTPRPQVVRMRNPLFGMLRALAPTAQPAHMRASRGLGKLLMLIARAPSENHEMRRAAAEMLQRLVGVQES